MRYTMAAHSKFALKGNALTLCSMQLTPMDRWILSRLAGVVSTVNSAMDDFSFHVATHALKSFFYQNFCDVYLVRFARWRGTGR